MARRSPWFVGRFQRTRRRSLIAAMDNTFLTLLLNPKAVPRPNPDTGFPVPNHKDRIDTLIDEFDSRGDTLIIPSPTLAECLCSAALPEAYLAELENYAAIEVASFDQRAAYELSQIIRKAQLQGDKRSGETGNWQHVKMDRAIVAIAVVNGATVFYSDDSRQSAFAALAGLSVVHTWDLPISAARAQGHLQEGSDERWPEQRTPPKPAADTRSEGV